MLFDAENARWSGAWVETDTNDDSCLTGSLIGMWITEHSFRISKICGDDSNNGETFTVHTKKDNKLPSIDSPHCTPEPDP